MTSEIAVPAPLRQGMRRHPRQAEIARAVRAAKQVGDEYGVRLEPDGSMLIGKLAGQGGTLTKIAPEMTWRL